MKIEWSKRFIDRCCAADRAFGWDDGETLSIVKDSFLRECSSNLDVIERGYYAAWDISRYIDLVNVGPFNVDVVNIVIRKEDIANWKSFYAYQKTMARLEGEQ